jgi:fructokinase
MSGRKHAFPTALPAQTLLALVGFVCTLSPQRLIPGGGVMDQPQLLPLIRGELVRLLNNGYIRVPQVLDDMDRYVVTPALGARARVIGALALAQELRPASA